MIWLKKNLPFLLATFILLVLGVVFPQKSFNPEPAASFTPQATSLAELVKVIRVVDGDTIEIEGGIKVRYIGINTPEISYKNQCYGNEASDKNKELVLGKEVKLEKDISETDKYGRLLRYVHLGGVLINDELVREGYAKISTYPPDVKYQNIFLESEKYARENNLGLWSACD